MKKLMFVAMVTCASLAFAEVNPISYFGEDGEKVLEGAFRARVTGFGGACLTMNIEGVGKTHGEVYGAGIDLLTKVYETENFRLWAGIGGAFTPNQDFASKSLGIIDDDGITRQEDYVKAEIEVAGGELRFMLEPEYDITESWSVGLRAGVAFDWVRMRGKATVSGTTIIAVPGMIPTEIPYGPESESATCTRFVAQGLVGAHTTYMLTENLGLTAAVDYRAGNDATFKKSGEKFGKLSLDGIYWGVGAVYNF